MIELLFKSGITYNDWVHGKTVETQCPDCESGRIFINTIGLKHIEVYGYDHDETCYYEDLDDGTKKAIRFQRLQFFKLLQYLTFAKVTGARDMAARSVASKFLALSDGQYGGYIIPGHGLAELAKTDLETAKMLANIASEVIEGVDMPPVPPLPVKSEWEQKYDEVYLKAKITVSAQQVERASAYLIKHP